MLGILDRESLGEGYDLLSRFPGPCGVLVQEQVPGGFELILGADSDPLLGACGPGRAGRDRRGGIFRRRPRTRPVLSGRRTSPARTPELPPILRGHRAGQVDLEQLSALMEKLQRLLLDLPEIEEMDLNPLIWDGVRFTAADYRDKDEG